MIRRLVTCADQEVGRAGGRGEEAAQRTGPLQLDEAERDAEEAELHEGHAQDAGHQEVDVAQVARLDRPKLTGGTPKPPPGGRRPARASAPRPPAGAAPPTRACCGLGWWRRTPPARSPAAGTFSSKPAGTTSTRSRLPSSSWASSALARPARAARCSRRRPRPSLRRRAAGVLGLVDQPELDGRRAAEVQHAEDEHDQERHEEAEEERPRGCGRTS